MNTALYLHLRLAIVDACHRSHHQELVPKVPAVLTSNAIRHAYGSRGAVPLCGEPRWREVAPDAKVTLRCLAAKQHA